MYVTVRDKNIHACTPVVNPRGISQIPEDRGCRPTTYRPSPNDLWTHLSTPERRLRTSTASTNSRRSTKPATPAVPYFISTSITSTDTCEQITTSATESQAGREATICQTLRLKQTYTRVKCSLAQLDRTPHFSKKKSPNYATTIARHNGHNPILVSSPRQPRGEKHAIETKARV